jgi:hypothetical protein
MVNTKTMITNKHSNQNEERTVAGKENRCLLTDFADYEISADPLGSVCVFVRDGVPLDEHIAIR